MSVFIFSNSPSKTSCQILFEIAHKHLAAFAGEDPPDIPAVVLKMIKDMGDFRFRSFSCREKSCVFSFVRFSAKTWSNISVQRAFKQLVLRFKMRVKCATPYICLIYDFLNRNIGICFLSSRSAKASNTACLVFFCRRSILASCTTFSRNCSVMYFLT